MLKDCIVLTPSFSLRWQCATRHSFSLILTVMLEIHHTVSGIFSYDGVKPFFTQPLGTAERQAGVMKESSEEINRELHIV